MAIRRLSDGSEPLPSDRAPFVVRLSPMRRKHVRAVARIEAQVSSTPWNAGLFMSELALRNKRAYTVAQVGSLVVGFGGLMFVDDEAHVTTIAVDPIWQRHKIATRLMLHSVRLALQQGISHLTLEVRASNKEAQSLYHKFGFAPAGVRKNYYTGLGGREDALVMWANDIDSEAYALRLSALEAAVPGATIAEVPR